MPNLGNDTGCSSQHRDDEPRNPPSELDRAAKKTLRASEQKEADRAAWQEQTQALDAQKLVFVDECGSNIALTRLYARSARGKRAYGAIPTTCATS